MVDQAKIQDMVCDAKYMAGHGLKYNYGAIFGPPINTHGHLDRQKTANRQSLLLSISSLFVVSVFRASISQGLQFYRHYRPSNQSQFYRSMRITRKEKIEALVKEGYSHEKYYELDILTGEKFGEGNDFQGKIY